MYRASLDTYFYKQGFLMKEVYTHSHAERGNEGKIKNILQKLRNSGAMETIGYDWILSKSKKA